MIIKSNLTEFKIWKYAVFILFLLSLFLKFNNHNLNESENFLDQEIIELQKKIKLGSNKEIEHLINFIKAAENTPNIFYIKEIYYNKKIKEISFKLKGNINKKVLKDLNVNPEEWVITDNSKKNEFNLIKKF